MIKLFLALVAVTFAAVSYAEGCTQRTYYRKDGGTTTVETCCYSGQCTSTTYRN
jgi:hypothetical protein